MLNAPNQGIRMSEKWSSFHEAKLKSNYPSWPVEAMVKVLFGSYLQAKPTLSEGMRVLDIGCGFGNNLLPFYFKGLECHGIEITQEIIEVTRKALAQKGITDIGLAVGSNATLPYPDNHFDLLISNNVLHYEGAEEKIEKGLAEYRRVLKPGGHLFLMTVGPEHDIYKRAKVVGPHQYQIQDYDFRNGEVYFYFDTAKYLDSYLSRYFSTTELGQVTERLMTLSLDFFIAVCKK